MTILRSRNIARCIEAPRINEFSHFGGPQTRYTVLYSRKWNGYGILKS
jgi:hypothetical protein